MSDPRPVFISYARDASREHARKLFEALGPDTAFLDTEAIGVGDPLPERLVDALFAARVVVIFAEPGYFTRRYCLYEFNVACEPFLRLAERQGVTEGEKEEALRGIVLALPPRGIDPMLERFPPGIQGINWPSVDDIPALASLVRRELATNPSTLRERYQAIGDAAERAKLLAATRLPTPLRIGRIPVVPAAKLPPSIHDAFVGRADGLWRIHHVLTTQSGSIANAAALTGSLEAMGGVGKTCVALEYLHRFGTREWQGGLFWINAEQDAELQLYDVLRALDPNTPEIAAIRQIPGGVYEKVARVIRALEGPRPLFIIDNVPEPEPNQPPKPLSTWCPVLGDVPVLTTSRRRVSLGSGGSVIALPINTLDSDSAVLLLTRGVSHDVLSKDEWKEIAEWGGYLPLALELLSGLLSSGAMTPRAVLEMSQTERPSEALDRSMEAIRSSVPEGSLRGITEAFSASYDRLTPEQQYAARLIAWMAPELIPEFVIKAFGPDVFTASVRAALRDRSFVTEARDGSGEYFGAMHRVLADFVRRQLAPPDDEIARVSSVLTVVMESAEEGDQGRRRVRACAPLVLAYFAHQQSLNSETSRSQEALSFANYAGVLLKQWGYPEIAENLLVSVLGFAELHLGEEHSGTLTIMNNLAPMLSARGAHAEAQELQQRVLKVRQRILGQEHLLTLGSMDNLASTLGDRGDHVRAQELKEQVLEAMQRVLGEEHLDTLISMSSLALTLSARGNHAHAQELQERVLEARRRILGEEHLDTLRSMHNLAITLTARGDLAGAQELHERVLKVMQRRMGAEHPDTLVSMSNLADTLSTRGAYGEAQELRERLLEARWRTLGEDHPDTLGSMTSLAVTLVAQGDHARAQELQERVLEASLRVLGEEHPNTLGAMHNLASTLSERGDHAKAQELKERVLEARQRILGEEHPDTLASMSNLANTLHARGNYADAQRLHEHALAAKRRIQGEEHLDTLGSMNNLAITLGARGDLAGAQKLQERLLGLMRRVLGGEHPDTLSSMNNLAVTLSDQGDYARAQALQEQAIRAMQQRLGLEHPMTTVIAWGLFSTLLAQGNVDAANRLLNKSLVWMLDREASSLSGQQQQIRGFVKEFIQTGRGVKQVKPWWKI